jgi:hypothetical protein
MSTPTDFVATAYIANGRLKLEQIDREALDEFLGSQDGREMVLTVRRKGSKRSADQNAFYHGVVLKLLSEHTGFEPEDMHEWLKKQFLPAKLLQVVTQHGEAIEHEVRPTTTTLTTEQFSQYWERIQRWAATDLGVVIPDPDRTYRVTRRRKAA